MSNFNDANELASNLVFGTNYHDNKPSTHHPKRLVFRRTTYVTITADANTHEEWVKVAGEIHDVLNEGYWLDEPTFHDGDLETIEESKRIANYGCDGCDDCPPLTADEAEERAADLEDFHSWQRKKLDNVEDL